MHRGIMVRNAYMTKGDSVTQTQQEYLNLAKKELVDMSGEKVTWDQFAVMCGIESRAFKTYRMPEGSKDYRAMQKLVRDAVERTIVEQRKESLKKVTK